MGKGHYDVQPICSKMNARENCGEMATGEGKNSRYIACNS